MKRALSKVSTPFGGYDVVRNNCQHFAVWAKYGKRTGSSKFRSRALPIFVFVLQTGDKGRG